MTNIKRELLAPRRQRRQESRENGTEFIPQYNGGEIAVRGRKLKVGGAPKTYKETYGIGYERFDGKYVKVSDKIDV